MAGTDPVAEQPYITGDAPPTPWFEARSRLAEAESSRVATVRPEGGPHVAPVLGVWVDEALHFCANPAPRKARNLARDPHRVVTARSGGLDLVVEGAATRVSGDAGLRRVAEAYMSAYGWPITVRDGALHGEGAPTAGPPPYDVYRVTPTTAFGFPADEAFTPTRWRF